MLASTAPGFADVLVYFRFDDPLAPMRVNRPRVSQQERQRSVYGTQETIARAGDWSACWG